MVLMGSQLILSDNIDWLKKGVAVRHESEPSKLYEFAGWDQHGQAYVKDPVTNEVFEVFDAFLTPWTNL